MFGKFAFMLDSVHLYWCSLYTDSTSILIKINLLPTARNNLVKTVYYIVTMSCVVFGCRKCDACEGGRGL